MIEVAGRSVTGLLFDKDGTLLDFHRTWDHAFGVALRELAADETSLRTAAAAVGYDLEAERVEPGSPVIAESNAVVMTLLERHIDVTDLEAVLLDLAVDSATPAPGADELVRSLRAAGAALAVVTNDSETVARRQLDHLGWGGVFDVVIGYDSGYGEKPDPGPVLAGVDHLGGSIEMVVMVGDTGHDLAAARRAEVTSVYVGRAPDLRDLADLAVADLFELASAIS